ncbi:MAG TPA: isochorismatase family protein [Thermomicrobiales bacterium]|nr:isochorismatase family protein [Thermomicrobiales bacterium]
MIDYHEKTALVVVDVQNDFADPRGSLYVSGGEQVVPPINAEIRRAREAGAPVLYTQDWHPPSTPHFEKDGGIWPVHCVMNTWGAAFHPDLDVDGEVVQKGSGGEDGYSGFTVRDPGSGDETRTMLGTLLRERGIKRVVIAGLATDYCVKETAIDAVGLGFETAVLIGMARAVNLDADDGERAVEAMREAGVGLA